MTNIFVANKLIKKCKRIIRRCYFYTLLEKNRRMRKLRQRALKLLDKQTQALAKENFVEEIVLGIAHKKTELIMTISDERDFDVLTACSYPQFNGTEFVSSVPEDFFIPEEECVHWVRFFAENLSSRAGSKRYNEVLAMVFPETEWYELQNLQKNNLKRKRTGEKYD